MNQVEAFSSISNNDKPEVTVTPNGDSQYGKTRGMGIDFPDVQVLHNNMSSTSPTSLIWHSVVSDLWSCPDWKRLDWQNNKLLALCILFSLMCLQTKGQETVMKRNMLAQFNKTSDSPECHGNLWLSDREKVAFGS